MSNGEPQWWYDQFKREPFPILVPMPHPFYIDFNKQATEIMTLAMGVGISNNQSHALVRAKMEALCRDYACRAAGIMSEDADKINRLVWYRDDGWQHGGSAISWQDRAEELEARVKAAEGCIEEIKQTNVNELGHVADAGIDRLIEKWEALDL